ncbi:MAG: GAK system ATP-grasp enzyme [Syntrophales bacterium]|jgi:ribosomal protein S6--L-glutamate ligase|nr:GAK system ATP-grasp enzyme [Syntrophales bacterium]MCK9392108.1 GAK system ATP-grasp enzyme [Syntrophales bacterium]
MIKIGVVGVAGGWSSEEIARTLEERTGYRLLIEMDHVKYSSERESMFFGDVDLMNLDGLIVKKIGARYSPDHLQRLDMLKYLYKRGLPVFSKPSAIAHCLDRLSCTLTLRNGGVPMPPTVLTEDIEEAADAVKNFGRAVFKPLFTSKARGMQIISGDDANLSARIREFKNMGNSVMYIQKMIHIPGRDLGVAFLNGKYIGTYARVSNGESWNTTTANGGRYEACDPESDVIELARHAQELFRLDFTCVDVVETVDGPMVFEVSALGGFRGLWEARRINVAGMIVHSVLESIGHGKLD